MKNLLLVRHAKSSWKDSSLPDFERPLNKRGKRNAPFMGSLLKNEYNIKPELVISSAAMRAAETAKIFCREIGYPKDKLLFTDKLYLSGPREMLEVIRSVDDSVDTLMIFAHNPGLTDLANRLSGEYIDNIPTAGIVGLSFDKSSWADLDSSSCSIVFFEYPKKYSAADEKE